MTCCVRAQSESGKYSDIAYAYDNHDICIFDFKRSQDAETWSYKAIEAIRDGFLFSSKYTSCCKINSGSKLLVFSNVYPELKKLSSDRWDIYHYDDMGQEFHGPVTLNRTHVAQVRNRESAGPHADTYVPVDSEQVRDAFENGIGVLGT